MIRDSVPEEPGDFEDSFLREVARGDSPPRLPLLGERMGGQDGRRFEILDELGGGGMSRVFRAWDLELQRMVALKFLSVGEVRARESPLALLKREAQAIARLDQENIVCIFDVSEWRGEPWEPGVPFLVMEYLEGESLSSLLKREQPGLRRTLQIMGGVAAGLAHAHARHITHRDLKPANVLLTRDGGVKLLDFGLAHLAATGTTQVLHLPTAGTPHYMPPEQWRGEAQDERTDIWAAGVMLYEMLAGERPYRAPSLDELRAQVTSPEPVPSVREHDPDLPEEMARLVARMLAKDPEQRMRSAAELRDQLHRLEETLGPWHDTHASSMPQRRQVTLVSCRLSGFSVPLDPEDASEFQAAFHRHCSEVVRQYGGAIALSVGEEVLACFGYPSAHEDDSAQAVRAALHLVHGPPLGDFSHAPHEGLAVQVGIHTDSVVFGSLSLESQGRMPTLQGVAPQVATWLAQEAEPGSVVLSSTTWTLVHGSFETESLGALSFAGHPGGQQVARHRVLRERAAVSRFERVIATHGLTPLVGRTHELERLLSFWERARNGTGAVVLLRGEAGLGKSRLLQELRDRVSPDTSHILRFQCWSQYHSNATHPAIEVLQRFFQFEPEGTPRQDWGGLEDLLEKAHLTPEHLRGMDGFLAKPGAGDPAALRTVLEQRKEYKQRLLELSRDLLFRMEQERPVLMSMEDLHWADPSTLELLSFLLDALEKARVLIVLSARPEFQAPWPARPWFHTLVLDRLAPESTAALVRTIAQGRSLPEETVQQLVARTDGVPLFVEELTRVVLGRAPTESPSAIPVTLHELLLARLDTLPPRQKALAQLCATVGRNFTHALLAQISARDDASLRKDLSGLVSAGVLQPQEDSVETGYQFRHALIQEAAYQSLPRSLRRQHHRRIAQALLEQFPDVVETRPEMLAHHFTESGEPEPALRYWKRATEHAILRSASPEAISALKQALELLRSLPDASKRGDEELQLLNALGGLIMDTQGYSAPELLLIYSRAQHLFRRLEELPQVDPLWMGLGSYFLMRGKFQEAEELATRFVHLGRRHPSPALRRQSYWILADISLLRGESTQALEYFAQVKDLEAFTVPYDKSLTQAFSEMLWVEARVGSLSLMAMAYSVRGELEQAWQCTREVRERIQTLERPATTAWGLIFLASACQIRRELECTLKWAEEGSALASGALFQPLQAGGKAVAGWAQCKQGRVREGLETLRSNVDLLRGQESKAFLPFNFGLLADVYLDLGRVQEGLDVVAEGLRIVEEAGMRLFEAELHRLRGELLRAAGKEEEATRHFLRARLVARRQQAALFELRATVSLGRQLREFGHPNAARWRLERILRRFSPDLDAVDLREARELLSQVRYDA